MTIQTDNRQDKTNSESCVVLVGMTGVGKSTVGTHLAKKLGRRFVDLDRYIVEKTGRPISTIFEEKGEDGFRRLESRALQDCLGLGNELVLATGGGVVTVEANRRLLTTLPGVVWLRADLEDLVSRVGSGAGRPLVADDPRGALSRLSVERSAWYSEVSSLAVSTGQRSIVQVVDTIAEMLEGPPIVEDQVEASGDHASTSVLAPPVAKSQSQSQSQSQSRNGDR